MNLSVIRFGDDFKLELEAVVQLLKGGIDEIVKIKDGFLWQRCKVEIKQGVKYVDVASWN